MDRADMIYTIIEEASKQKTNLGKARALSSKDAAVREDLRKYLHYVKDPTWCYYTTLNNLPEPAECFLEYDINPQDAGLDALYRLLLDLHERVYTGKDADEIIAGFLFWASPLMRQLFKWAIDRKLPANMGRSIINAQFKDLIYKQPYGGVQPWDADKAADLDWSAGVMVEQKEDGMALMIDMGSREVRTRAGQNVSVQMREHLGPLYRIFPSDGVLFVEARMYKSDYSGLMPRPESNGVFNAIFKTRRKVPSTRMLFIALDWIDRGEFFGWKKPKEWAVNRYDQMLDEVNEYNTAKTDELAWPSLCTVGFSMCYSLDEARAICQRIIASGGEGVVLKDQKAPFKNGKSGIKMKNEFECSLLCVGHKPHTKNPEWVGSLEMVSKTESGEKPIRTFVGSGLNEIHGDPLDRTQGIDAFIGQVFEIRAEKISKNNALDLPRIVEPRLDKTQPDTPSEVRGAYNDSISC